MPSSAYHLLNLAFGRGFPSPLGMHPRDKEAAENYFAAAWNAKLTWAEVEADIREFLATTNTKPADVEKQLDRARKFYRK